MEKIDKYIPVTKAKSQILNIIRDIGIYDNTLAITKNGLPHAVLMSMDHYVALQETMEILSDSETMRQLHDSKSQSACPFVFSFVFKNSYDLSDLIIAHSAKEQGCENVLTFDKKALKYNLFELVR